jgi:hypothetical protein
MKLTRNGRGTAAREAPLSGNRDLQPVNKSMKGLNVENEIYSRRIVTIVFALISGASAVSLAVLPAVF